MQSQKWTTLALAVMVGLTWGYIAIFQGFGEAPAPGMDRIFPPDWRTDAISNFTVEGEYGPIRLEAIPPEDETKRPDWKVVGPVEDAADSGAVSGLLGQVLSLTKGTAVEEGEFEEAKYGLDEPRLEIEVTKDGEVARIEVGNSTPLGTSVYVRVEGLRSVREDAVWVVSGSFVRSAQRPVEGFRQTALAKFHPSDVRKIELQARPEVTAEPVSIVLVQKDKSEPWEMTSPHAEPAGQGAVQALLGALARARAVEFAEPAPDEEFGLDRPILVATVADEEGRESGPYRIGRVEKDGETRFYARAEGRDAILVLGPAAGSLAIEPNDLRLRDLFSQLRGFDPVDRYTGFRFGLAAEHWSLTQDPRKGGEWQIVMHDPAGGEPDLFDVNPQSLRDFKDVLRKIRIEEFVTEEPTEAQKAEWQVDPPRWALGFVEVVDGQPQANHIWFGKVVGEGPARRVYARIEGRGKGIVTLNAEAANLSTDGTRPEDYRSREVWRLPPTGRVVAVETSTGKKVTRGPDDEKGQPTWVAEGVAEPNRWMIWFELVATRYRDAAWVSMKGQVEDPAATVTVTWEDEKKETHELVIRYASVPDRPAPGAEIPTPEPVKASVEGVEGVFLVDPRQVWAHLDVPEPRPAEEGEEGK